MAILVARTNLPIWDFQKLASLSVTLLLAWTGLDLVCRLDSTCCLVYILFPVILSLSLGVIQNCHHFQESTQSTLGEGVKGCCMLFLNVDYDALHFHTRVAKINIFKVCTLLGGREGVTKKSTLCTLLIMLIIMDDPLTQLRLNVLYCNTPLNGHNLFNG